MFMAMLALVWGMLTGHATYYGYPTNGAANGGVVVSTGPGQCVGYEIYGTPGWFGNAYGLTGGDCG